MLTEHVEVHLFFVFFYMHCNCSVENMNEMRGHISPAYCDLLTFLCTWGLRAATLIPGHWLVSVSGAAFIPDRGVEGETAESLCPEEAAHSRCDPRRSLGASVEGQSGYCGRCPVCVNEHGVLRHCLLQTPMQSFQYLRISHVCVLCGFSFNSTCTELTYFNTVDS